MGYFRFFHSTTVEGIEKIPQQGPCIIASNHTSYFDPVLINMAQPTLLKIMAWEGLFNGKKFEQAMRDWGAFPVDAEGKDPGGYREALTHLKAGAHVLIFPEGSRSYDGKMMPFRDGFARLAIQARAPIVPACIVGAERAWPRGDLSPRLWFPIHLRFLEPISPRPAHGPQEKRDEAKRLSDEIRAAIQRELDANEP